MISLRKISNVIADSCTYEARLYRSNIGVFGYLATRCHDAAHAVLETSQQFSSKYLNRHYFMIDTDGTIKEVTFGFFQRTARRLGYYENTHFNRVWQHAAKNAFSADLEEETVRFSADVLLRLATSTRLNGQAKVDHLRLSFTVTDNKSGYIYTCLSVKSTLDNEYQFRFVMHDGGPWCISATNVSNIPHFKDKLNQFVIDHFPRYELLPELLPRQQSYGPVKKKDLNDMAIKAKDFRVDLFLEQLWHYSLCLTAKKFSMFSSEIATHSLL